MLSGEIALKNNHYYYYYYVFVQRMLQEITNECHTASTLDEALGLWIPETAGYAYFNWRSSHDISLLSSLNFRAVLQA